MSVEKSNSPLKSEEIDKVVKDVVEGMISEKAEYVHSQIQLWCNQIVESCTKKFLELSDAPVKYITSCVILQNKGIGVHAASACHWDAQSDVSTTVKHEVPEMICIVTVYSIGI
ncbi:dynein light chain Tctex-type 1-like protein [Perkinsela sp. CCAP 1560/4]|nr:dynein light chain Tctex-type 1-like protein [Perkinsela sp. CCAP 1560/4]|eukprot:KNH04246.1 dynein light chain Tctex-type 1-like protein [Perkinsela sp. CCAP 1560/4]